MTSLLLLLLLLCTAYFKRTNLFSWPWVVNANVLLLVCFYGLSVGIFITVYEYTIILHCLFVYLRYVITRYITTARRTTAMNTV